ncbi:MAG: hypothetical protein P8X82_10055, partial [Gemmatimonadales bacterium]
MKATLRQPSRWAVSARASGDAASARVSVSRDLLMSQFWQNLQLYLADDSAALDIESAGVIPLPR